MSQLQQILRIDGEARFQALQTMRAAKLLLDKVPDSPAFQGARDTLSLELLAFEQKFGSLLVIE